MDIAEFRKAGYLQEVNRRFLHPLGMSLYVDIHEDGTETLGGIIDCRSDPEGTIYAESELDEEFTERAHAIQEDFGTRLDRRRLSLGYGIQLPPGDELLQQAEIKENIAILLLVKLYGNGKIYNLIMPSGGQDRSPGNEWVAVARTGNHPEPICGAATAAGLLAQIQAAGLR